MDWLLWGTRFMGRARQRDEARAPCHRMEFLAPFVRESPFITQRHAPLTPTGRLRMVLRHLDEGAPESHMATEFPVLSPRWRSGVNYLPYREVGWSTAPAPHIRRARTPTAVAGFIESLRRERKSSVRRIPQRLLALGHEPHLHTVGRWLAWMRTLGCAMSPRPGTTWGDHPGGFWRPDPGT